MSKETLFRTKTEELPLSELQNPSSGELIRVLNTQLAEARKGTLTNFEVIDTELVDGVPDDGEILEADFKQKSTGESPYVLSEKINGRLLGRNESLLLPRNERIKRAFDGLTLADYTIVLRIMLKDKSFVSRWLAFAELSNHSYGDGMMNSLDKVSKMTDREFQALQTPKVESFDSEEEVINGEIVENDDANLANQPKINPAVTKSSAPNTIDQTKISSGNRSEQFSRNGNKVDQTEIKLDVITADKNLANETRRMLNFGGIPTPEFGWFMKNAEAENDPLKVAMAILKHCNENPNSPVDKFAVKFYAIVEKFAADPRSKAQKDLGEMYVEFGNSESGERMEPNQIIKELNRTGRYEDSKLFVETVGKVMQEIDANYRGMNIGEEIKPDETKDKI